MQMKEKTSKASMKHTGEDREASREPNEEYFLGPHPYPVKSPVFHWHPVLSFLYMHSTIENKNMRK